MQQQKKHKKKNARAVNINNEKASHMMLMCELDLVNILRL